MLAYSGAGGYFFFATFGYIAASPSTYITVYHGPPQLYSLPFGAGIVGIMVTSSLNARLVMSFGGDRLLLAGAWIAATAAVILAVASRTGWED